MLKWLDILKMARDGVTPPAQKIIKSESDWRALLTDEQFYVTRKKGTERPFSSEMCSLFEPGIYACTCCGTKLFDSYEKFDSGTGWPSFTQPLAENAVSYVKDTSHGMTRIEALCNTCDAHLGHVFQDGPPPSGLRYCINAVSLQKVKDVEAKLVIGGGCFWCTEAIFQNIKGIKAVVSGYSGGHVHNPTYKEVCSELTGHAEVVEISYDPTIISVKDIISIHLITHDPTTLNRQGADRGTQYRSVIFYRNEEEKIIAEQTLAEIQELYTDPIVTQIAPLNVFYKAEDYHQNYYNNNPDAGYCSMVIAPKVNKFRQQYKDLLVT
ncbi:MAG TPA: bifunctional methionine sulfoxide reductase B/A protein [Saprospiraceae bacterium]|nr:bifunctional methionine sulfoxide reductase B/A protein [Saprospiraceae bacterium]